MHLQFVGCGDAFGSGGRLNTCFHVVSPQANFLIDCGASSLIGLKRLQISRDAVDLILITHFHADHFGGLPFFLLDAQFTHRSRPLTIVGPPAIEERLRNARETAFAGSSEIVPRFPLTVTSVRAEEPVTLGSVQITAFDVIHADVGGPFFGYRIAVGGRIIAYSGDTEWTENLIRIGADADLFVCEAYSRHRPVKAHLALSALEKRLGEINPKRLILTHLGEDMLEREDHEREVAKDGLIVPL